VSLASTKPYLLRAIFEWCMDQGFAPYIAVVVDERTEVPRPYVKDGQIVLNIGPEAAHQLHLGNEFITLAARFGGVAQNLSVPVEQVAAIYARENGYGMAFEIGPGAESPAESAMPQAEAPVAESPEAAPAAEPARPAPGRPHLVRIK
jgi:stringent starvation protein B